MRSRKDATLMVNYLINDAKIPEDWPAFGHAGNTWHFGRQELRHLMDFIYGGEPADDDEKIGS